MKSSASLLHNLLCQSYWLVAPIPPPPPTLFPALHNAYDQVAGMIGHAGCEFAPGNFAAKPSPMIGTTLHDQRHSKWRYDFATHFAIGDRLMGTLHPNCDDLITSYPAKSPALDSKETGSPR